ncbi:hypothetical protein [Pseudomonas putida]|uniref:Uncharacterized protein n=1 Tax=Pseudomonas putida TaxID=303 RepID=A0A8I1ED21_PSEPU|nr:hypothetical protein [Pseudomonas putida]MBI6883039.1 hypothetical protein [Pseudomonas putida]
MTSENLPNGFNCVQCNHFAEFSMWVYAQWDEKLTSTCTKCSTIHTLFRGIAKRSHEKLSPDARRADLSSACEELGFELVWTNLRTGEFHMKKGEEVRLGAFAKTARDAGPAVALAAKSGQRLDLQQGSKYYAESSANG